MKNKYTKQERLNHANELIKVISEHGRHFFYNKEKNSLAELRIDENGRVWFKDDYTKKWIFTHKTNWTNTWKGFSHGGTLQDLIQQMREYIIKGTQIHEGYIGLKRTYQDGNIWGYPDEDLKKVLENAKKIPIIYSVDACNKTEETV